MPRTHKMRAGTRKRRPTATRNKKYIKNRRSAYHQQKQLLSLQRQVQFQHSKLRDAKKTKKDEHTSIYERCCVELDKISNPRPLDIILGIQEIYLKEQRPVNNVTIQGYSLTYMLTKGIISKEKNANLILSKLNI